MLNNIYSFNSVPEYMWKTLLWFELVCCNRTFQSVDLHVVCTQYACDYVESVYDNRLVEVCRCCAYNWMGESFNVKGSSEGLVLMS